MATVSLVFERTIVKIGAVALDVSISESHSSVNEVTDHPVEAGVNIVDHVRPKPDVLKLEGLVSNTPLPDPSAPATSNTFAGKTFLARSGADTSAATTAYRDLLDLKDNATLVTVVTGLRTYENMVIETLDVPRDARTGATLRFSCTLKQVRIVTSQTVQVIPQTKISKGKKATKDTSPQQDSTILSDVDDATGGALRGGYKALIRVLH